MDNLFASFRSPAADGLRLALSVQKEASEALLAQSRHAEKQLHAAMEMNREAFLAWSHAAQAMGKVMVDAMKPADPAKAAA